MDYLLDSASLKHYWTKIDFQTLIYFLSSHFKMWEFSIPIIMASHLAHRWFYSEKETNKVDLFYRLQRHFNIKILLDEMIHLL